MEIKDILLNNENALPTLQQNLSTTTATTTPSLPTITASESTYWKTGVGTVVGLAGTFYLIWGKKSNDVQKMVIGVVLTLASIFFF